MTLLLTVLFVVGHILAASTAFQHPGVLVNKAQLDFIKEQVSKQAQPIYGAYQKAVASKYASLKYNAEGPPANGVIECGSYSRPDYGCSAADSDGAAALTQALLWYVTGNHEYAANAIKIMNNYSQKLKSYTNSNAPLQAGWDTQKWPAAAEIIRYSNANWSESEISAFAKMLTSVQLPMIDKGSDSNGNWEISMIDGMIGIAVFTEDQSLFDKAVTYWQQRIPAYFYYHTDGNKPKPAPRGHPSWYGQDVYNSSVDGIAQETCRDFGHTEYGIAGALHAAETARIQGQKLYEQDQARLIAGLEFHSYYLLGNTVPKDICGGKVNLLKYPTFEVGYNEYHNRMGLSLPHTAEWISKGVRTAPTPVDAHMMVFETLTHGANGS